MEKNLIIGAFTGYDFEQLKPWVLSIDSCGFKGDKVMIVGESSQETKEKLIQHGFILYEMLNIQAPIHVARFLSIYTYLKENPNYNIVVTTDVKDVYFQKDPCQWVFDNLGNKSLVAGSESIRYKDEPWGRDNLKQTYGPFVYDLFKDNIIYNVGTLGGVSEYVQDLCFNIVTNAVNRPIPIVDQAVYNVLINTQPYKDVVLFTNQLDGWAVQLGTTADPSKINEFKPNLTEKEPIFDFENKLVKTSNGEVFSIVHQYDRVPSWKKIVSEMYGQESTEDMFIYRV